MAISSTSTSFVIGLCQILPTADKSNNIALAKAAITQAAEQGADLVMLPECWNSPYSTDAFPEYAELIPTSFDASTTLTDAKLSMPSSTFLSSIAKDLGIFLVGGSIPEQSTTSKIYNTCLVFNPEGELVAKHRKMHLFDIHVPGKINFRESDTLSPGNDLSSFQLGSFTIGLGICYDIRFPELSLVLREQRGVHVLLFPGAFNLTTGPAHWELLQRARAVDQQVYLATCSPARDNASSGSYQAWGHSSVVDPWGSVIATTGECPDVVLATIDLEKVASVRQNMPISRQKRYDVYCVSSEVPKVE